MAATTLQNAQFPAKPYTPPTLRVGVDDVSPFQRVGFNFLLIFLFLAFSRVFDVKFTSLHITGISYRIAFAMTILSGAFVVALKTDIGKALLGFTVCFGMSVPFSVWRGGSLPIFKDGWLMFSFVAFLATAGLILTYAQTVKAVNSLAWGLMVFVIIANVFGSMETGRLFLADGKFSNPNEMAQALLIGMPLWAAKMDTAQHPFKKLFAGGVILTMLMTVYRTGSRGAMVAFMVMFLLMFLRASIMGRMRMLLGCVVLAGIVLVAMPGHLMSRYKMIASDDADDEEMDAGMRDSAYSSTQSRKALLKTSLLFTIKHPLFGVGPGMFPVAEDNYAKEQGKRKGQWLGTHNSYTQVSSELGIPAFCFFMIAMYRATKGSYSMYKQTRGDPRTADIGSLALGLHYAMVVFAVTILFEHIAYTVMLPVFGGLVAALMRTSGPELARRMAMPAPTTLAAPAFRTYSPVKPA